MALKPHFKLGVDDINFRCNNVAEAGLLVVYSTVAGEVTLPTNPSGKTVAGLLLTGVVNRAVPSELADLGDPVGTVTFPRNFSKNETHISGMVRLLKIGEAESNKLDASDTFAAGDDLYVTTNGVISKVKDNAGIDRIGHALAAKDSDGYLKIFVNIS